MRKLVFFLFVLASFPTKAEIETPNLRLLQPAMSLHFCVEKEARDHISSTSQKNFSSGPEAEGWLWSKVSGKCIQIVSSLENEGTLSRK